MDAASPESSRPIAASRIWRSLTRSRWGGGSIADLGLAYDDIANILSFSALKLIGRYDRRLVAEITEQELTQLDEFVKLRCDLTSEARIRSWYG